MERRFFSHWLRMQLPSIKQPCSCIYHFCLAHFFSLKNSLFTLRIKRRIPKKLKENSETHYYFWEVSPFLHSICLPVAQKQTDTVLQNLTTAKSLHSWSLQLVKNMYRHVWGESYQSGQFCYHLSGESETYFCWG